MALNPFIPTESSTHQTFRNGYNANMSEAESRISNAEASISGLESNTGGYALTGHQHVVADVSGLGTMATADTGDYSQTGHTHSEYAATSHTHVVTDINSAAAPSGYVITADGSGNATWEEQQGGGGGNFSLVTVTTPTYTQIAQHTHHNYDDDAAFPGGGSGSGSGGAGPLYVDLLDPTLHEGCCGVTVHKKVGSTADVVLVPPSGCTIDGITGDGDTVGLHLTSQWEAVSIYSDGVSGYYIQ